MRCWCASVKMRCCYRRQKPAAFERLDGVMRGNPRWNDLKRTFLQSVRIEKLQCK